MNHVDPWNKLQDRQNPSSIKRDENNSNEWNDWVRKEKETAKKIPKCVDKIDLNQVDSKKSGEKHQTL